MDGLVIRDRRKPRIVSREPGTRLLCPTGENRGSARQVGPCFYIETSRSLSRTAHFNSKSSQLFADLVMITERPRVNEVFSVVSGLSRAPFSVVILSDSAVLPCRD